MATSTTLIAHALQQTILAEAISRGAKLAHCGNEWIGPCPRCGGRDRFSINIRKRLFCCRGCQVGGDVITLVQHLEGCDFSTAVAQLAGSASVATRSCFERPHPSKASPVAHSPQTDTTAAALAIWEEARNPTGTLGELYFNKRSLRISADVAGDVLRFHGALLFDGHRVPGLVALFRDVLTDEPTGIQRVFLQRNGERIARRMLGRVRGAAIKLDGDAEVAEGLHICEGFETGTAARTLRFKPVWAVGSAGGIQKFPVLPGVEALSIFLETDDQGANERAAQKCAKRWAEASREVLLVTPLLVGDMNDVARRCANVG